MKHIKKLIALLLVLVILSGCSFKDIQQFHKKPLTSPVQSSEDLLVYSRPDIAEHDRVLEKACQTARTETDPDTLIDQIYAYYDIYDRFYASYDISYIRYCSDVTNTYWAQENDYCAQYIATVDAGLESLHYALAQSPIRKQLESDDYFGEGYFDNYEGDNQWEDPQLLALMDEENALISEYYSLSEAYNDSDYYSDSWFDINEPKLGQLLVDLIRVRQQQADHLGYDSYPAMAYDLYHYRDYSPQQAKTYLSEVGDQLSSIYQRCNDSDVWALGWEESTEEENFLFVKEVSNAMGGDVAEAFTFLEDNKLFDIAQGKNKSPTSFEVFILYYYVPYIFMAPEGTVYDKLSFAHEFGHFINDYLCEGSYAGTDVAEVHSQAMEYLSLLYGQNTQDLLQLKLASSLCLYVEQAAYALFEHQVYDLQGEDLTVENIQSLYAQICTDFGFGAWGWDSRDYIAVPHFYDQPLYIISYVVSNDLAMQIYQLEQETSGAGLEIYKNCLYSNDCYIMTFATQYGLESPFAPGRLESARKTFEAVLE